MAVKPFNLKVCCWNILADVYSHRQLQKWESRILQIEKYLLKSKAEIICLQEVDHFKDSISPFFNSMDYECIYFQRPEREDGCLIAYKRNLFDIGPVDYVSFDDVASLMAGDPSHDASYKKRNIAMFTQFKTKVNCGDNILKTGANSNSNSDIRSNGNSFIVANTHIYWNPNKPKVKLTQTQYLIDRLKNFMYENKLPLTTPVIAAGDFNSLPESELYNYLMRSTGFDLSPGISYVKNEFYGPDTKFLCDHSLSRLCRWMRILGIDTAMYDKDGNSDTTVACEVSSITSLGINRVNGIAPVDSTMATDIDSSTNAAMTAEVTSLINPQSFISPSSIAFPSSSSTSSYTNNRNRKAKSFDGIFSRAKLENRVILTTSKQMTERSQCPQARLIQSSKLKNLELELAKICRTYNLVLNPERFLTVCGKCGGEIELCDIKDIQLYHNSASTTSLSLIEEKVEVEVEGEDTNAEERKIVVSANSIESVSDSNISSNRYSTVSDSNSNNIANTAAATAISPTTTTNGATATASTTAAGGGGVSADLLMNRKIKFLPTDRPVYKCADCHQPYWWSDRESSSPARAMRMADKLHKVVVKHLNETDGSGNDIISTTVGDSIDNNNDVDVEVIRLVGDTTEIEGSDEVGTDDVEGGVIGDEDDKEEEEIRMEVRANNNKFSQVTGFLDGMFANRDKYMLSQQQQQLTFEEKIRKSNWNLGNSSSDGENTTSPLENMFASATLSEDMNESSNTNSTSINDNATNNIGDESGIIHFTSAYLKKHGQEPIMTNWCDDFKGTLDYIFVSDGITVKSAHVIPHVKGSKAKDISIDSSQCLAEGIATEHSIVSSRILLTELSSTVADVKNEMVDDLFDLEVTSSQPSSDWPSDHFMILVDLEFPNLQ